MKTKTRAKKESVRSSRSPKKAKRPARTAAKKRRWQLPKWISPLYWFVPIVLVAITFAVIHLTKSKYPLSFTSAKLVTLAENASKQPVGERVAFWSEQLQNNPRLLSVWGKGPAVNDSVPIFSHKYDCTTFVETVGGLARSQSIDLAAEEIVRIRYGFGTVSFENRNHFPELDWIPNNASKGILKDITVALMKQAGLTQIYAKKDIDRPAWLAQQQDRANSRAIASVASETHTVTVPYVPVSKIDQVVGQIPQGAVVNIVRQDTRRAPTLITHQGFLIWKDGQAYFRHANRLHQITDMPLKKYIAVHCCGGRKVIGFNINQFEM